MDWEKIIIKERPDSVTWEEISSVLTQAHKANVEKGIVLPYPQLPPEAIKAKTEARGGKMFVALYEGKVVGTGAVAIIEKDFWCGQGRYAYCFLDAVLPEYAGKGVYRRIVTAQEEFAISSGVTRMLFDTDDKNYRMLKISKKHGYLPVEFRVKESRNSIVLVKWLEERPYSWFQCYRMFRRIRRNKLKRHKIKSAIN